MAWLAVVTALLGAFIVDAPQVEVALPGLDPVLGTQPAADPVALDPGLRAEVGPMELGVDARVHVGLDPHAYLLVGPPAQAASAAASATRDEPAGDRAPQGMASVWARFRPVDFDAGPTASLGLVLSLAFASGLFSRIHGPAALRHPLRQELHDALANLPGASPKELQALLGRPWGTIAYHLRRLESAGLLVSGSDGRSIRFWQTGAGRIEKEDGLALGTGSRRAVAELVQEDPGIRPSQLSVRLGVGRAAVSKHLRALGASGIVRIEREGAAARCYPVA